MRILREGGIDETAIFNLLSPYLESMYNLMTMSLAIVLAVVIAWQSYKYIATTEEDERSWKEWIKRVGKILIVGLIIVLAPQIIKAFGL
ncbi:MAG: hypothetical protein ACK5LZ_04800 [Anaerorhabdus sp.]